MEQGRHRVISYKVHKQISVPEDEWFVVPNTHEAIIDRETFEKAQALHKRDTRTAPGKQEVYLMSGFVRCADCKKAMRRKTARNIAYYSCRSYTDKKICSKHSIRQDKLENAVLAALQMQIALVDQLAEAGQKYWQLLPLGPTSYGDSPYQSFSSFAGNPYFIDLDLLVKDKLLTRAEVNACDWGDDPRYVDYGKIYASRFTLLEKAKARGFTRDREAVAAFERENERWLPNYALFMALKRHFGMKSWTEWDDEDIRCRTSSEVVERYRAELREDVELFTYI